MSAPAHGSNPVFDLVARRAARTRDDRAVIDNLIAGADALAAEVHGWPFRVVREGTIAGLERQLEAMQALLIELRTYVEGGPTNAA